MNLRRIGRLTAKGNTDVFEVGVDPENYRVIIQGLRDGRVASLRLRFEPDQAETIAKMMIEAADEVRKSGAVAFPRIVSTPTSPAKQG